MKKSDKELMRFISFESSYVTKIYVSPSNFTIEIDCALMDEHPLYEENLGLNKACFKKACLVFHNFSSLSWESKKLLPAKSASGEIDYGSFDLFYVDAAGAKFSGEWGLIAIVGGELSFRFL